MNRITLTKLPPHFYQAHLKDAREKFSWDVQVIPQYEGSNIPLIIYPILTQLIKNRQASDNSH